VVDETHYSCWLLLQALFMIASVLTADNATAVSTIAKGVFIVTSLLRVLGGRMLPHHDMRRRSVAEASNNSAASMCDTSQARHSKV
jgi:hypothetical protein